MDNNLPNNNPPPVPDTTPPVATPMSPPNVAEPVPNIPPEPLPPPPPPVTEPPPQKKGSNFLIIFLVLLLLLVIGGGIYFFLFLSKISEEGTTGTSNNQSSVSQMVTEEPTLIPTVTQNASSSSGMISIPLGYLAKETLCYTVIIPETADTGEENDCNLSYRSYINASDSSDLLIGSSITAETREYKSLQDMVDYWENSIKGNADKIISQEAVTIGLLKGERVLVQNETSKIQSSNVFIFLPNKYNYKGSPVYGFSILTTYSDPDRINLQKAEENRLLSSWQWK